MKDGKGGGKEEGRLKIFDTLQASNQAREFALHGHVVERGQRRRRVGPEGSREPAHLRGRPEPVRLLQEARLGACEFARRYRGGSSWRGGGVGAGVVVVVGVVVGRGVLRKEIQGPGRV